MKKTLKSLKKWYKGYELQPGDLRRIDALWFEIKCISITILTVIFILWVLWSFGAFVGKEQWQYQKY